MRRATVPLEVVLSFPLLVLLFAMMLWLGRAGTAKSAATTDARAAVWHERDTVRAVAPFANNGPLLDGWHDATPTRSLSGVGPVPGLPTYAGEHSGTIFDTWADTFEFAELPSPSIRLRMHHQELTTLVERNPETLQGLVPHLGALANLDVLKPAQGK